MDATLAAFDDAWNTHLRLRSHDCCSHVTALALRLTGVPDVLAADPRLQRRVGG